MPVRLIFGRAGSGKTVFVMSEIKRKIEEGGKNLILVVPEQYSHDAERQLLRVCGNRLSAGGEVLSFSRIASRVLSETGGAAKKIIDKGAAMLVMNRAQSAVSERLRAFGASSRRVDMLEKLMETANEFKMCCVSPDELYSLSLKTAPPLSDKLYDLSLLIIAYDAMIKAEGVDSVSRLALLEERIEESTFGDSGAIYFDGFNDFTAQEMRVIDELFRKNADMTFCLTCDGGDEEMFDVPRKTASLLRRRAESFGETVETVLLDSATRRVPALTHIEKNLFLLEPERFSGESDAVELIKAPSIRSECEIIAARILELVRGGMRWRDIQVVARNWEEYSTYCENAFEKNEIPFFTNTKEDILQKPPVALINFALSVVARGWDRESVISYLKTGLADILPDDCNELENYVEKWNIRGSLWTKKEGWIFSPSGFDGGGEKNEEKLRHINAIRQKVVAPLERLQNDIKRGATVREKLQVLHDFLVEIDLPGNLSEKVEKLTGENELQLAGQYTRIWEILVEAMNQFEVISGGMTMDIGEFARLFSIILSQYDIGLIPVSLDRVAIGEMSKNKRRDVKCLIILGATDENMPRLAESGGILSDSEREEVALLGAEIPAGTELRLSREMNMIYSSITLPSDRLIVSYPEAQGKRPSTIVRTLERMFDLEIKQESVEEYMSHSPGACFELAFLDGYADSGKTAAVRELVSQDAGFSRFSGAAERAAKMERGTLSPEYAELLYGSRLRLSATQLDKFKGCEFAYFIQNGLRAKKQRAAAIDALTEGTFMHFILENVTNEIKSTVGFKNCDAALCGELTAKYVAEYEKLVLNDLSDTTERFKYLFGRLARQAASIVADMAEELKRSDFEPIEFELKFLETVVESDGGERELQISGIVDRVDMWVSGDLRYLRIVDYKTGSKSFSLSDIWHGMGLQMLIYLFALQRKGAAETGESLVPAGVLYAPAKEVLLNAERDISDEKLAEAREKKLRRSGLLLDNAEVLEAMENGDNKKFIPVTFKDKGVTGSCIASLERFGKLSSHIDKVLKQVADEIRAGSIRANPVYKNTKDNACVYCDAAPACMFNDRTDKRNFLERLKIPDAWEKIEGGAADER